MKMLHSHNKCTFDFSETISKRDIVFFYLRNVIASWNALKASRSISTMLEITAWSLINHANDAVHLNRHKTSASIWRSSAKIMLPIRCSAKFRSSNSCFFFFKNASHAIHYPVTTQHWGWSFSPHVHHVHVSSLAFVMPLSPKCKQWVSRSPAVSAPCHLNPPHK